MSDFDKQIRKRQEHNKLHFSRAVHSLAGTINRKEIYESGMHLNDAEDASFYEICRFYGFPDIELPSEISGAEEKMNYLLEARGIMRRHITLDDAWWTFMSGPILCKRKKDGEYTALLQNAAGRYYYKDRSSSRKVRVRKENAGLFESDAICFYRPLPSGKLTGRDLMQFAFRIPSVNDWVVMLAVTLIITLVGMITPVVTELLFSSVIPAGSYERLIATAVMLIAIAFGTYLLKIFNSICNARITQKVSNGLFSAAFSRMLSMPTGFFKPYGAGDMASRLEAVQTLGTTLMSTLLNGGISTLFSLIYIFQIFNLAPGMVLPALGAIALQFTVSIILILSQRNLQNRMVRANAQLSGTVFSLLSGIQKIKLAGAENRAFHRWAGSYQEKAKAQYAPPVSMIVLSVLTGTMSIVGSMIIYAAGASVLTLSSYMAFQTAYGMTASAIMNFSSLAGQLSGVGPSLELAGPLLETEPEIAGERETVHELEGKIDLSNLSFRYDDDGPWILDGIDLTIAPGSYVAIVGTTGCGKSTLLRVLLGFEMPQSGSVFYDGKDIKRLDIRSLRRLIGTVLQDGKLFSGSIMGNILICSKEKTPAAAWEAAETAQIAEDIRRMPMGMYTDMTGGAVSGGQRQRILIARAVAAKPKILIFDEATSALDNVTQAKVSESLDRMKCTRIVVAHRLSTIRNCDRIIVLDKGRIIEDGSYDDLLKKNGFFAGLVARQRPES